MKIVELRRHAERDANEDLTEAGRAQCALARGSLEFPYDAYYVSPAKRARLTMAAFGVTQASVEERLGPRPRPPFAPFERRHEDLLNEGLDAVTAWFAIREALPLLLAHGREVAGGVRDIADKLTDGGRALAVSHGGTIEPFAVAVTGRPYEHLFGYELAYCEGVRGSLRGLDVVRIDVVRLPPP